MKHSELVIATANRAEVSASVVSDVLDAHRAEVWAALKRGDIALVKGIGTFYVGIRTARTGRNPRTGQVIHIRAAKKFKLKASGPANDNLN